MVNVKLLSAGSNAGPARFRWQGQMHPSQPEVHRLGIWFAVRMAGPPPQGIPRLQKGHLGIQPVAKSTPPDLGRLLGNVYSHIKATLQRGPRRFRRPSAHPF